MSEGRECREGDTISMFNFKNKNDLGMTFILDTFINVVSS